MAARLSDGPGFVTLRAVSLQDVGRCRGRRRGTMKIVDAKSSPSRWKRLASARRDHDPPHRKRQGELSRRGGRAG